MTEIYSFLLNLLSASIPSATTFSPNFLKAITNEEIVRPSFGLAMSSTLSNHALRHSPRQPSISPLLLIVITSSVTGDRPRWRPRL